MAVQHFDGGGAVLAQREAAAASARADSDAAVAAYTASHTMSRDDFLKKYGTTFVADDKGGNAASEVAGQDVGAYYDRYLDPKAPKFETVHTLRDGDRTQAVSFGGGSQYANSKPIFDAYDNVAPHPTSNRLSGLDQVWTDMIRPIGTIAAAAYGGSALMGLGATTGAAAAAATPATGLAGTLGMDAGLGATALNTGALNTSMSLLRGKNIGDSLKDGATGALLSPVSGYVSGLTGGGPLGNLAGNTALGGVQGLVNGQGFAKGATNGLVNGIVSTAGSYMGDQAKGLTGGNKFAGTAANALTQTALKGGDANATIDSLATQYASGQLKDLTGLDPSVANLVVQAARGKKIDPAGALTQYARSTANAVGGNALKKATMGNGAVGALTQTGGV